MATRLLPSFAVFASALLTLVFAGCSTNAIDEEPAAEPVHATLLLRRGRVQALRVVPAPANAEETARRPPSDHELRWILRDGAGTTLDSGSIDDPRFAHDEFSEAASAKTDVGTLNLDLPASGQLTILEPAGTEWRSIGVTKIALPERDPEGKSTEALLDPKTDILGSPVVVRASKVRNPVKLLFVAEGYREEELTQFHADVAGIADKLSKVAGYEEHWDSIAVYRQDVRSTESGIGDPKNGIEKNTAFEVELGDDQTRSRRCVWFNGSTQGAALAAMETTVARLGADAVVYLANSTEYGGCANNQIVITRHPASGDVVAHELGHKLFALNDEYWSSKDRDSCHEHRWRGPNVADDLASLPWADLVNAPLPTSSGADASRVGAFEGGGGCPVGVYRPQADCAMHSLGKDFCAVCRREIDRFFAKRAAR